MHTPGPWKFSHKGDGSYRIEARQGPLDVMPATVYGLTDARLIAAAPEMLTALRSLTNEATGLWSVYEDAMREAMGNTNYRVMLDKIEEARAILANATEPRP